MGNTSWIQNGVLQFMVEKEAMKLILNDGKLNFILEKSQWDLIRAIFPDTPNGAHEPTREELLSFRVIAGLFYYIGQCEGEANGTINLEGIKPPMEDVHFPLKPERVRTEGYQAKFPNFKFKDEA